jgi:hypothetical protein
VTIQKRALSNEEKGLKNNNEKKRIFQKSSFFNKSPRVQDDSNDLWTSLDMTNLDDQDLNGRDPTPLAVLEVYIYIYIYLYIYIHIYIHIYIIYI